MTDNEIIKTLECCEEKNCTDCPAFDESIDCGEKTIQLAIDLINRQQAEIAKKDEIIKAQGDKIFLYEQVFKGKKAEIERYKGVIKLLESDVKEAQAELKEFKALYVNKVAEMGIKAFAKRLCRDRVSNDPVVIAVKTELKMTEQSTGYGSSKTEGK